MDDEASLLRERLRTGGLDRERLQLAAYVEHAGALRALETVDPALPAPPGDLTPWVLGLERWGWPVVARSMLEVVRLALPIAQSEVPDLPVLVEAVVAADAWIACPCAACLERVSTIGRGLEGEYFAVCRSLRANEPPTALPPPPAPGARYTAEHIRFPRETPGFIAYIACMSAMNVMEDTPEGQPPRFRDNVRAGLGQALRAGVAPTTLRRSISEAIAGWALRSVAE